MGLAPLLTNKLIEPETLIVDAKTGVSGGGRTPKLALHYPECNESIAAYNIGMHRHSPEMVQELSKLAGRNVNLVFVPHLTPMDRGILSTIYCSNPQAISDRQIFETFEEFYCDKPFVRIKSNLPRTKDVSGTNFCDIAVRIVANQIIVVSCIDNLLKGASGMAVQNFNLMFGFDETTALLV